MSLSADGTTIAIGSPYNTSNTGHVRVYQYDSTKTTAVTDESSANFGPVGWNRVGHDIDGEAGGDYSGWSVSLSADGSIVAIGARGNNSYTGHVKVYQLLPSMTTSLVLSDVSLNGIPTAPTATSGTNTTQLATTAFVTTAVAAGGVDTDSDLSLNAGLSVGGDVSFNKGLSVGGNLNVTGTVSGPTATSGTNTTQLATTAFVTDAVASGGVDLTQDITVNSLTVGKGSGNVATNTAFGIDALTANTTGQNNVATGYQALVGNTTGNFNVANGFKSLFNNTTGGSNVANGYQALYSNTTGQHNVANGNDTLKNNTTGGFNVANGTSALWNNTTGYHNTAIGTNSLYSNTTGWMNTSTGSNSLNTNTTGNYNVANGTNTLKSNTTGGNNTATGYNTLNSNTTGGNNTATGYNTGMNNTTTSKNTFIGVNADLNSYGASWSESTALGYAAKITASNQIMLGRSSETVVVPGTLSKSSGTFKIDHPLPEKRDTHNLVHSFIEGPRMDNIYRGHIHLVNGLAEINLDTQFNMTEGTFIALNRDISVFTTNEDDWDNVRGKVTGNILTIECQNTESTALISYLVIGERQDKHAKESYITDMDGRLITEPLKIRV